MIHISFCQNYRQEVPANITQSLINKAITSYYSSVLWTYLFVLRISINYYITKTLPKRSMVKHYWGQE